MSTLFWIFFEHFPSFHLYACGTGYNLRLRTAGKPISATHSCCVNRSLRTSSIDPPKCQFPYHWPAQVVAHPPNDRGGRLPRHSRKDRGLVQLVQTSSGNSSLHCDFAALHHARIAVPRFARSQSAGGTTQSKSQQLSRQESPYVAAFRLPAGLRSSQPERKHGGRGARGVPSPLFF